MESLLMMFVTIWRLTRLLAINNDLHEIFHLVRRQVDCLTILTWRQILGWLTSRTEWRSFPWSWLWIRFRRWRNLDNFKLSRVWGLMWSTCHLKWINWRESRRWCIQCTWRQCCHLGCLLVAFRRLICFEVDKWWLGWLWRLRNVLMLQRGNRSWKIGCSRHDFHGSTILTR